MKPSSALEVKRMTQKSGGFNNEVPRNILSGLGREQRMIQGVAVEDLKKLQIPSSSIQRSSEFQVPNIPTFKLNFG
jgi:hypothetical protein